LKQLAALKKNLLIALLSWFGVAFLLIVSTTLAIYTGQLNKNLTIRVSNISAQADIYFVQDNSSIVRPIPYAYNGIVDDRGMVYVDVRDPEASNYIGRLKIDILYKGIVPGYVRLKFIEEWHRVTITNVGTDEDPTYVQTETIAREFTPPYLINATNWHDHRLYDQYFYYKLPIQSSTTQSASTFYFINGFVDDDIYPIEDIITPKTTRYYYLRIGIIVEAVQQSRYQQIWGIDDLPFAS
jgi:hypothetical protein